MKLPASSSTNITISNGCRDMLPRFSLQDWRTYSLGCWECCQQIAHSWQELCLKLPPCLAQGHIPFTRQPASNDWLMFDTKAWLPGPNSGKLWKAILTSKLPMGGWGGSWGCHWVALQPISSRTGLSSLPFHRHCFQQHSPLNSQPANLHLRGRPLRNPTCNTVLFKHH